jgi:very-short-patch-repair endonuclease
MAAVLACGPGAVLSHESAAVLWGIRRSRPGKVQISVPTAGGRRRDGITVHRRRLLTGRDLTHRRGIPVTGIVCTIVDLTSELRINQVERVINEADQLGLIDPETLRRALEDTRRRPGVAKLRALLDRRTFRLTRSELERLFLGIVRRAGLPMPLTRQIVNGFEVDFYWPELGLVVETDGLRYHRTPQQQERGLVRDQIHAGAGLIPLRYSHGQIKFNEEHVQAVLVAGAVRAVSP